MFLKLRIVPIQIYSSMHRVYNHLWIIFHLLSILSIQSLLHTGAVDQLRSKVWHPQLFPFAPSFSSKRQCVGSGFGPGAKIDGLSARIVTMNVADNSSIEKDCSDVLWDSDSVVLCVTPAAMGLQQPVVIEVFQIMLTKSQMFLT